MKKKGKVAPRILFFDIETMANLAYVWGKYEQNVIAYKKEWEMLSFAYKFLGDLDVTCHTREGQKSDKLLVQKLQKLFEEADIVVAHNGDSFDIKKVKARMIFHRLAPPKVITSIDTKLVARRYFAFNGNGLDELGEHLGLGRKLKHQGFDLWLGCAADDPKCWKTMERYNKRDIVLLEKVYKRFLPYIQNHPNIARVLNPTIKPGDGCPNCGSGDIEKRGIKFTFAQVKRNWRCLDCTARFTSPLEKGAKR